MARRMVSPAASWGGDRRTAMSRSPIDGQRRLLRASVGALAAATLAAAVGIIGTSGSAGADPPAGDHSEPTWVNGQVRTVNLLFADESRAEQRQPGFVVGPPRPRPSSGPRRRRRLHPGCRRGRAADDHVLRPIPYGQREICRPFAVLAVQSSDLSERVHVRDTGLAYEINLGDGWTPLVTADA